MYITIIAKVELLLENKVETKDALLHAINEEYVEAVEVSYLFFLCIKLTWSRSSCGTQVQ